MYQWEAEGNMTFCVKRINPSLNRVDLNGKCKENMTLCNGYCFEDSSECPITTINILKPGSTKIGNTERIFYTTTIGTRYLYSKQEGRPIINLIATFRQRCSNDYHFTDRF